ncbi:hypothetical protein [Halobacillus litoralis]|uniref:hypothetical protein n=1 Tax=Halobacillus litoralis TaxID=45668 RepID=UPI0024920CED|nr:hypothetical protein [Halobacillus litoralis]
MSELDTKQRVLVAFYTEYQKDLPNMGEVTAEAVGMSQNKFAMAIKKLENEGLLTGGKYAKGDSVFTDFVMVTNYGLAYVEEKLEIQPTMSAGEKTKEVTKKAGLWGYNELKDFAVKVTAEMLKG